MIDVDGIATKLTRLDHLLGLLEQARARGQAALTSDIHLQLQVERALQVSIQICIDVGAHLVSELGFKPAEDYPGVFTSLAAHGGITENLAGRLRDAAVLRNLLVYGYCDIDPARLWEATGRLDDLREFAGDASFLARARK